MTWEPLVASAIGVVVALISLLRTFVVAGRDQSAKVHDAIEHLTARIELIEMKLGLFWKLVEEHLSGMLKRPTHSEMDALLDKLKAHTLTLDEAYLLRTWVREVYIDEQRTASQQRIIAILVLGAVDSLIQELERCR